MVTFILLLLAFLAFVLAAFGVNARIDLIALGLALWVLVALVNAWPGQ